MKIRQNSDGRVLIELSNDETSDLQEQVDSLLTFVCKQAITIHRLTISYRKLVQRLDELEAKPQQLSKKD